MEQKEILGILESFHFFSKSNEGKLKFIEDMFQISMVIDEVLYQVEYLIELIQIRLEQTETCEECHGFGCQACRGTGKKSVYR